MTLPRVTPPQGRPLGRSPQKGVDEQRSMKLSDNNSSGRRPIFAVTVVSAAMVLLATILLLLIHGIWAPMKGLAVHTVCGPNPLAEELNNLVPECWCRSSSCAHLACLTTVAVPRQPRVFWNDSGYGPQRMREDLSPDEVDSLLRRWHRLLPRRCYPRRLDNSPGISLVN